MSSHFSKMDSHRCWLESEFESKKSRNPQYSLRSFARSLGISPATLSQVLRGRGKLGLRSAKKIADRYCMSPQERRQFLEPLVTGHAGSVQEDKNSAVLLEADQFQLISDWYHFGILGLANLKENILSPGWVSSALGIKQREAKSGLERLFRLCLIEKTRSGFRQSTEPVITTSDTPDLAIKKFHKQMIKKAENAIDDVKVDQRDISSITLSIDPQKLKAAKAKIAEFREEMSKLLETGEQTEVYNLSINLFPLTNFSDQNKESSE